MSESNHGLSAGLFMTAFATGALVGGAAALLFAPQTGKQTRDMVADKTRDLKDEAGDVIERGKKLAHDARDYAAEKVGNKLDESEAESEKEKEDA